VPLAFTSVSDEQAVTTGPGAAAGVRRTKGMRRGSPGQRQGRNPLSQLPAGRRGGRHPACLAQDRVPLGQGRQAAVPEDPGRSPPLSRCRDPRASRGTARGGCGLRTRFVLHVRLHRSQCIVSPTICWSSGRGRVGQTGLPAPLGTPSSRAGSRGSCTTSTVARCPMSGRIPSSKATDARPRCDGATARPTSASTMSTARYSTARTSGPAAAASSSRRCGRRWPSWPTWPGRPGGSQTRASGRYAARAGSSPTPRRCARWPWTGPRPSPSGSACPDRFRPGEPPPPSCGRRSCTSPGMRMPRR
jgi:hypothetical protein